MRWWKKRRGLKSTATGTPETANKDLAIDVLAGRHLGEEMAARWLNLTRPAIQFASALDGQDPIMHLGGRPLVPTDFSWPVWEGHGPLNYVAGLDLRAVASSGLEHGLSLPKTGWLHFFYYDGSYDDFDSVVGPWDPTSRAGARVVHISDDMGPLARVAPPDGVLEFSRHDLAGRQILTFPNWEHPALRREFHPEGGEYSEWLSHPVNSDAFTTALDERSGGGPRHRLGGWSDPVQGPVEFEAAAIAGDMPLGEITGADESLALRWHLLLQIDSDSTADMMWGDCGTLYWMAQEGESGHITIESTSFTWQCS